MTKVYILRSKSIRNYYAKIFLYKKSINSNTKGGGGQLIHAGTSIMHGGSAPDSLEAAAFCCGCISAALCSLTLDEGLILFRND